MEKTQQGFVSVLARFQDMALQGGFAGGDGRRACAEQLRDAVEFQCLDGGAELVDASGVEGEGQRRVLAKEAARSGQCFALGDQVRQGIVVDRRPHRQ